MHLCRVNGLMALHRSDWFRVSNHEGTGCCRDECPERRKRRRDDWRRQGLGFRVKRVGTRETTGGKRQLGVARETTGGKRQLGVARETTGDGTCD